MRLRILAVSLAPLLAASLAAPLAHAQAPGQIAAPPVVGAPIAAAPVAAPCSGSGPESVMANRWASGLAVGSMSLAPEGSPDDHTTFAVGELALRFRATPHLELALSAGGGRERTADDQDGDLEVSAVAIAARYRFRPEAAWNWFVMAGVGGASVTRHDATQQERSDATQPLGMLGVGIERRFHHLALQAELHAVGLGEAKQDAPAIEDPPVAAPAAMAQATTAGPARSGGALSIGLSYYF